MLQNTADTGQRGHAEEVGVVFLIARGHAAMFFERAKEAFHHIAPRIASGLDSGGPSSPPTATTYCWSPTWNDGPNTTTAQPVANVGRVIAAVGQELTWASTHPYLVTKRFKLGTIMPLAGRQMQGQRRPRPITDHMQLAGQPAAAAPEALGFFFVPPAALLVARTVVESTSHVSRSNKPAASRRRRNWCNTRSKVPSAAHRRNRSYAVCQGP